MRHLLIPILSLLPLAPACNRKPPKAVVPPLPAVKVEDVASPASPTVTIARRSNLRKVATTAYGHEDFSGFVAACSASPGRRLGVFGVPGFLLLPSALRQTARLLACSYPMRRVMRWHSFHTTGPATSFHFA